MVVTTEKIWLFPVVTTIELDSLYRVCGLAVTAGIAMKFSTAHGRSRLGVGSAKRIGSYGRKGVPPAPCNVGAS